MWMTPLTIWRAPCSAYFLGHLGQYFLLGTAPSHPGCKCIITFLGVNNRWNKDRGQTWCTTIYREKSPPRAQRREVHNSTIFSESWFSTDWLICRSQCFNAWGIQVGVRIPSLHNVYGLSNGIILFNDVLQWWSPLYQLQVWTWSFGGLLARRCYYFLDWGSIYCNGVV